MLVFQMTHDSLVARGPVPGCYSCEHDAQPALRPHEPAPRCSQAALGPGKKGSVGSPSDISRPA